MKRKKNRRNNDKIEEFLEYFYIIFLGVLALALSIANIIALLISE